MANEKSQAVVPRIHARDPTVFQALHTEDPTDWLERYEQVAEFNGWTLEHWLNSVGMFLEKVASNWYLNRLRPVTFNLFRQAPNYTLMLDTKLRNQTQGMDESPVHYRYEVLTLFMLYMLN